uniref:EF-hand domain-containing protein n=1 Tax=Anopheles stephensi TaxID=30069 RepID=A0A182YRR3_ANOST
MFWTYFPRACGVQKSAQNGTTSVAESLYKNKSSLEAIFRILDKDNSGQISLEEFGEACELLRRHFPHNTHEQLLDMCRMMDINKDGLVDLNEFLETFRLCENAKEQLLTSLEERANAESNGNGQSDGVEQEAGHLTSQSNGSSTKAAGELPDRNGNCASKTADHGKSDGRRRSKKRASGKRSNGQTNGVPEADEDTDDYEDYETNEEAVDESRESRSVGAVNGTVINSSNTAAVANSTANGDTHKDTIVS